ncbi:hypothetical protein ACQR16_00645 [Bradyrhizobium oligotrophicum]|uniref:hypothetical protein n=1 Tax=Bradyrhizobium oligotrophicum TaxID=44255 RepID=UPI003EC014B3
MGPRLRRERASGRRDAPADRAAIDAAWHVLEAANELGDEAVVAACRRVIDSNLNGTVADQADVKLVTDYFR